MKYYISIVVLLASFNFNAGAADKKQCQYEGVITHFKSTLILVNEIRHELCSSEKKSYTFPEIAESIKPAVSLLEIEFESKFPGQKAWLGPWLTILEGVPNYDEDGRLLKFDSIITSNVTILQYGSKHLSPTFSTSDCRKCAKAIKESGQLIQHLIDGFMKRDLTETQNYYAVLSKNWDNYLEDSRSQTWLDEIATQFFYSPDIDNLVGPPETQYFLLHPTVLIENVSDAIDGDQQNEAIGLELFGFNWWQKSVPFGASIGWVYSDRQSIKDTGEAIFFHVDNAYTLGYSKHGGDSGWFVSVDLLKVFGDKKSELKSWNRKFTNKVKAQE